MGDMPTIHPSGTDIWCIIILFTYFLFSNLGYKKLLKTDTYGTAGVVKVTVLCFFATFYVTCGSSGNPMIKFSCINTSSDFMI
jgi:hypothetical protein